jgi:hypothetical protein
MKYRVEKMKETDINKNQANASQCNGMQSRKEEYQMKVRMRCVREIVL